MRAIRFGFSILSLMIIVTAFADQNRGSLKSAVSDSGSGPFFIGERLVFTVQWEPPWYLFFLPTMEAGEVELLMSGEFEQNGQKVIKILFHARSSGKLSSFLGIKVDDEFVFIAEPETFCSLSVYQKIREGKRKRQIEVEYLRKTGQLHIREIDESVTPPVLKKDEIKDGIPSCVQDPFSAIYLLRMSALYDKYTREFTIGNDDKVREVRVIVEKQEAVETPVGKFSAWRLNTVALMGELFKEGGQFRLWLSADERKLPVQFEARVRLGRTLGKLKSVVNPSPDNLAP